MSAKIMGQVWDYALPRSERDVLLALADHADHNGDHARPGVGLLAWKTGLSEREVQYALAWLREAGAIVQEAHARPGRATEYRIVLRSLTAKAPYEREKDAALASFKKEATEQKDARRTQTKGEKDAKSGKKDARALAPEPSLEPSLEPRTFRAQAREGEEAKTEETMDALSELHRDAKDERTVAREQRALAKAAQATWLAAARKCANPYTDHAALRSVGEQAIEATKWEDGAVVLASISRVDGQSSPRRIPEWARLEGADRRNREHDERKTRERAERDVIVEHEGTRYLGHVPVMVGSHCTQCRGTLADHVLARTQRLRPLGDVLAVVVESARARTA